jgi:hypothetical protein
MKLLDFQKRVNAIAKDQTNPHFKNTYFDINKLLEEIKPILNELELTLIQPIKCVDGKMILKTLIIDNDKVITESEMILPDIQDPQKIGSAISYYRRYSIQSLLALQAQDDDANIVTNKPNYQPQGRL